MKVQLVQNSSTAKSNLFTPCLAYKQNKRHPRHQAKELEEDQRAPVSGYCTALYQKHWQTERQIQIQQRHLTPLFQVIASDNKPAVRIKLRICYK
jgi:hypothetical protein